MLRSNAFMHVRESVHGVYRVRIYRIKPDLRNVNGRGKVIEDPHPYPNQHQYLTTSRGSSLTHAYRVWSTSVNAFVS